MGIVYCLIVLELKVCFIGDSVGLIVSAIRSNARSVTSSD
jgi:hypothetical protein